MPRKAAAKKPTKKTSAAKRPKRPAKAPSARSKPPKPSAKRPAPGLRPPAPDPDVIPLSEVKYLKSGSDLGIRRQVHFLSLDLQRRLPSMRPPEIREANVLLDGLLARMMRGDNPKDQRFAVRYLKQFAEIQLRHQADHIKFSIGAMEAYAAEAIARQDGGSEGSARFTIEQFSQLLAAFQDGQHPMAADPDGSKARNNGP